MNQRTIALGILLLSLVSVMLFAGCTSLNPSGGQQPAPAQPAVTATQPSNEGGPQPSSAAEVTSASPDQGLVSDDTADVTSQADIIGSSQETNLTEDSPDLGDILP